jgi:hypothetical protein
VIAADSRFVPASALHAEEGPAGKDWTSLRDTCRVGARKGAEPPQQPHPRHSEDES